MKRLIVTMLCGALLLPVANYVTAEVVAQGRQTTPPPPPPPAPPAAPVGPDAPPPPPPPPSAAPRAQSTANVQLDVVITDTKDGKPIKKTVSMLIRSGQRAQIRSSGSRGVSVTPGQGQPMIFLPSELNIDAGATEMSGQLINVIATFEFTPTSDSQTPAQGATNQLRQQINVMLRNGKPLLVSRSADPVTDRTVTVELTATIREQ